MSRSRIEWLDSAKGLGTLLVILGHNLGFIYGQPDWHRFIYTFHMPLFFLATGVTLNLSQERAIYKRALTIAIPYIAMSAIMMPITHQFDRSTSYFDLALGIIYGTGHTIDIVPLWFLTCTASSLLLVGILLFLLKRMNFDLEKYSFEIALILLTIGYGLISQFQYHIKFNYGWGEAHMSGLPWNMDLAPIAAGYMLLGKSLSNKLGDTSNDSKTALSLIFIGCTIILFVLVFEFGAKVDLNFRRIDDLFLGAICSFLGIVASLALCIACQPLKYFRALLSYVTGSGLIILWLHGGLQNKGFKIFFGNFFQEQTLIFWSSAFLFATITPILIDRLIIKKTPLKSVFYPQIK